MKKKASPFKAVAIAAALLFTVCIISCQKDNHAPTPTPAPAPTTNVAVTSQAHLDSVEAEKANLASLRKLNPTVSIISVTKSLNNLLIHYKATGGHFVAVHFTEGLNTAFLPARPAPVDTVEKFKYNGKPMDIPVDSIRVDPATGTYVTKVLVPPSSPAGKMTFFLITFEEYHCTGFADLAWSKNYDYTYAP